VQSVRTSGGTTNSAFCSSLQKTARENYAPLARSYAKFSVKYAIDQKDLCCVPERWEFTKWATDSRWKTFLGNAFGPWGSPCPLPLQDLQFRCCHIPTALQKCVMSTDIVIHSNCGFIVKFNDVSILLQTSATTTYLFVAAWVFFYSLKQLEWMFIILGPQYPKDHSF